MQGKSRMDRELLDTGEMAGHQAVMTTGQWESEQARIAGFSAARTAGVDFDYDEREFRPRGGQEPSPLLSHGLCWSAFRGDALCTISQAASAETRYLPLAG